jgi:hypothetical protein
MKWNWQLGLGCVLVVFSMTKIGTLLSLTSESNAGEWGEATGVLLAFCGGVYLILHSRAKPSGQ